MLKFFKLKKTVCIKTLKFELMFKCKLDIYYIKFIKSYTWVEKVILYCVIYLFFHHKFFVWKFVFIIAIGEIVVKYIICTKKNN